MMCNNLIHVLVIFTLFLKFKSFTKMSGPPLQKHAQLARRYEVWKSVVQVQRWCKTIKERRA